MFNLLRYILYDIYMILHDINLRYKLFYRQYFNVNELR